MQFSTSCEDTPARKRLLIEISTNSDLVDQRPYGHRFKGFTPGFIANEQDVLPSPRTDGTCEPRGAVFARPTTSNSTHTHYDQKLEGQATD